MKSSFRYISAAYVVIGLVLLMTFLFVPARSSSGAIHSRAGLVYVYPNPAFPDSIVTVRAEKISSGLVRARVYDLAGNLQVEGTLSAVDADRSRSYEWRLPPGRLRAGTYVGVVTSAGFNEPFRFTVVK